MEADDLKIYVDKRTFELAKAQCDRCFTQNQNSINAHKLDVVYDAMKADKNILGVSISLATICMYKINLDVLKGFNKIPDYFLTCSNVVDFTIPDGIKIIGEQAFAFCNDLTSLVIPASLEIIEANAFKGCKNLKTVYFKGKKEDLNVRGIYEQNDYFKDAELVYLG